MNRFALIALLLSSFTISGQEIPVPNHFIELHYTGLAYSTLGTDVRSWNSGFGATINRSITSVFSLELAYDRAYISETRNRPGQVTYYHTPAQVMSLRAGFGKTTPDWSVKGLAGIGARFSGKIHQNSVIGGSNGVPPQYDDRITKGIAKFSVDLGVRGTYNLNAQTSLNVTAYVNGSWIYYEDNPHYGYDDLHPLNTFGLLFVNAGIAYRFSAH